MISVHFQGKPFTITVIQVYVPTSNAEEAEIEQFYEDLLEKAMAPHSSTLAWKIPLGGGAWWAAVHGVARSRTRLSDFTLTFHFHALEEEMATHSSVLAWRIQWTEEPGGLPSMGSHRVGHDWSDLAVAEAWRPTRPSRTNTQKRCPFRYRGLQCKSRKSRNTW